MGQRNSRGLAFVRSLLAPPARGGFSMDRTASLAGSPSQLRCHAVNLQLHRSVTFWSGILAMGFICWAWRDSYRNTFHVGFRSVNVSASAGGIVAARSPRTSLTGALEWGRDSRQMRIQMEILPPPLYTRGRGDGKPLPAAVEGSARSSIYSLEELWILLEPFNSKDSSAIFVPYWLLLLAIALPWTALLFWRARWRKRATGLRADAM